VGDKALEFLKSMTTYTDVLAAYGYRCGLSGINADAKTLSSN
jgi:hypothetical protein